MEQESKKKGNEHTEGAEPKISELEKWLESFRSAHGHKRLLEEVHLITGRKKSTKERVEKGKSLHSHEMKISEIENLFRTFKAEHGHKKLEESINSAAKKPDAMKINETPKHAVYANKKTFMQNLKSLSIKTVLRNTRDFVVRSYLFIKRAMQSRRYRYPTIVVGLFLGIYLLFNLPLIYSRISWQKPPDTQKMIVRSEEVVQRKMADSAALAPGEVIPTESRIIIPKISVNAPVQFADTKDEKSIEAMLRNGLVQYQGTAKPGEVGNSFITGHSSNYWWDTGKYNQIFVMLDKLEPGDQVVAYQNSKKFVYTVRDKVVVEPTDMTVLAPTNTPVLSLMTCTPPGTSWKRLVVRLDRTDPVYYKPETVTKEKVVDAPKPVENQSFISKIFSIFTPN